MKSTHVCAPDLLLPSDLLSVESHSLHRGQWGIHLVWPMSGFHSVGEAVYKWMLCFGVWVGYYMFLTSVTASTPKGPKISISKQQRSCVGMRGRDSPSVWSHCRRQARWEEKEGLEGNHFGMGSPQVGRPPRWWGGFDLGKLKTKIKIHC
jgi:hypothetical protein